VNDARVSVRLAGEADLPALERDVRPSFGRTHGDELADQAKGIHDWFIAVSPDGVLGSGFVRWAGPRDAEAARRFPDAPEIYRLDVAEAARSRGIGTALIAAMEAAASARGICSISLGVGHGNLGALRLYERLGFARTSLDEYIDEYRYETADGRVATARDLCRYLVKLL